MLPALKELAKLADCYLFENGIIENRQLEVYKSYATLCPVYREAKNELTQLKNELFLSEQKVKNFVKTEENKNEYLIKKKNILYKKIILLEKEKSNNSTGGIFKQFNKLKTKIISIKGYYRKKPNNFLKKHKIIETRIKGGSLQGESAYKLFEVGHLAFEKILTPQVFPRPEQVSMSGATITIGNLAGLILFTECIRLRAKEFS